MGLPFSAEQFFDVFRRYNEAVWPAQAVAVLLCVALLALAIRGVSARVAYLSLAAMWAWNGVAYHIAFFSGINPAARVFGAVFIVQSMIFAWAAYRTHERFRFSRGAWMAALVLGYGVVGYPLLGWSLGHTYPASPVLGVAPCPTTIFTLGTLMLCEGRVRWWLAAVPLLWAVVGTSVAFALGVREDLGLGASALLFLGWMLARRR
jgi:hypothetical protein